MTELLLQHIMVTVIAGKSPLNHRVFPANTAFSVPVKMMYPTHDSKKCHKMMPHRSNTEFRRVRSSAHRVRGRLSAIQNQIGFEVLVFACITRSLIISTFHVHYRTKLFKNDTMGNENANEKTIRLLMKFYNAYLKA